MLDLSKCLKLSTDYILNGDVRNEIEIEAPEVIAMNLILKNCRETERTKMLNMMKVFLEN